MVAPRFSIVIPTRDRPHTLIFTIKSCLAQDWQDLEVLVSDNGSSPQTRELVDQYSDPRLRYIRTPAPLAMADSFEFAVAQANGQYVIIQGDDDGLLRHAIPVIDNALRATNTPLLRWECAVYNWPDVSNPHFQAGTLLLPLTQSRSKHALRICDSRRTIQATANGYSNYAELPIINSAAIQRDLLDRLRSRAGRVFKTRTPDVYTAFALTALVDEFYSINAPLGISGRCSGSIGVARHYCKKGSSIDNEFRQFNSTAGFDLHPWVPDLPPIASAVADAFLWAKHDLFPDNDLVLDRRLLIKNCIREMEIDSAAEWYEVLASCRQALIDAPELLAWFEREYGSQEFTALVPPHRSHHWRRYGGDYLHLNTFEFEVQNIDDAAALCEKILGYKKDGLVLKIERFDDNRASLSELQEKEAAIQYMHSALQEKEAAIQQLHGEAEARLDIVKRLKADCDVLKAVCDEKDKQIACLHGEAEARLNIITDLRNTLRRVGASRDELQAEYNRMEREFHSVLQSRSWRITSPLRIVAAVLRRFAPDLASHPHDR